MGEYQFRKRYGVPRLWLRFYCAMILSTALSSGPPASATLPPLSIVVTVGEETKTFTAGEVSTWYGLYTRYSYRRDLRVEMESEVCRAQHPVHCALALQVRSRQHLILGHTYEFIPARAESALNALAQELDRPPVNARFTVTDGVITVAEEERLGYTLAVPAALEVLTSALAMSPLPGTIPLPTTITSPDLRAADQERLGLRELVGEGKTNFAGSPKNRVFNIKRALQEFDGVLLAPQEEFSFVDQLGPVDGEHGYLPELVIKHNRTEPEFGGGICQVSSTLFRAAFHSGLKITERRNHAYPVSYYRPYGMDATIYIPKPDLKFLNNTPGYILLQPKIEGTTLTFQVFGTKDGRTVTIDGPHILERRPDGGMRTLFTETVTDATGAIIIEDNFFSNYKSPSLFPHPGEEVLTAKPRNWSEKQWREYLRTRPAGR